DYLNPYIGGTAPASDLNLGISSSPGIPKILKCPADKIEITISWASFGQRRSYSMNGDNRLPAGASRPPIPSHGVGIHLSGPGGSIPPAEPPGYKASIIADAAGTILLTEQPKGGNIAGNDYPSYSRGPKGPYMDEQTPFQIPTGDPRRHGEAAYKHHGNRFVYLFHDGHSEVLKVEQTIGSGTLLAPKGMWTTIAGD
ncbi:MAG: hypothetical protein H7Y43_07825, partial [Akkermansiaceae bacterium]|nr:hypothetical protein [Verrucomicrobiales bacterium]